MKIKCQCGTISIIKEVNYDRDFDKPAVECPNCSKWFTFDVFDDEGETIGDYIHIVECPFCSENIRLSIEGYYKIEYSTSARIADKTEKECD